MIHEIYASHFDVWTLLAHTHIAAEIKALQLLLPMLVYQAHPPHQQLASFFVAI